MTDPINTDPPVTIEPTPETIPDPATSDALGMHVLKMGSDNVPYTEWVPLSEIPTATLWEMTQSGNEVAAQEIAWRMDQDTPDEEST